MELQADGEKSDDSEELQAHDANKDVSINDEDEQLREALYGTQSVLSFLILQRPDVVRKRECARPCMIIYMPAHTPYTSSIPNGAKCAANVKILF